MYLVVDTWVWAKAQQFESVSAGIVLHLIYENRHNIVCDQDFEIENEYWNHLREFKGLFVKMVSRGIIIHRPRSTINLDELIGFKFDPADKKFIEVAITMRALVIGGERHFMRLKKRIENDLTLRSKLNNIDIDTPDEAIKKI